MATGSADRRVPTTRMPSARPEPRNFAPDAAQPDDPQRLAGDLASVKRAPVEVAAGALANARGKSFSSAIMAAMAHSAIGSVLPAPRPLVTGMLPCQRSPRLRFETPAGQLMHEAQLRRAAGDAVGRREA